MTTGAQLARETFFREGGLMTRERFVAYGSAAWLASSSHRYRERCFFFFLFSFESAPKERKKKERKNKKDKTEREREREQSGEHKEKNQCAMYHAMEYTAAVYSYVGQ